MNSKYTNNFSWESVYGHLVKLLEGHAASGQCILDLGCGFGPVAEPLAEQGFIYVGVDRDTDGLESLHQRGFEVHEANLAEVGVLADRIAKLGAGRDLGAILALDFIEHLPDADAFLSVLAEVAADLGDPVLAISIPNVAHFDLAAKLLLGRWDITTTGLLDRTHLQFFTEYGLQQRFGVAGWHEVARNDYLVTISDQHFPQDSPALVAGLPLHDFLWNVRTAGRDDASTNQFVRVFKRGQPQVLAAEPLQDSPFLSVLVRTQGRRMPNLLEALTCLAAQDDQDFEVHVFVHGGDRETSTQVQNMVEWFSPSFTARTHVAPVTGGGRSSPLNLGLERARGRYVAFLDDDDLVTANWVSSFRAGANQSPGQVVRTVTAERDVERSDSPGTLAPYVPRGRTHVRFPASFDLLAHFVTNQTPNCSVAIPMEAVRALNLRFDDSFPVLEDWHFLIRAAMLCAVHQVPEVTSIYQRWQTNESSLNTVPQQVWLDTYRRVLSDLDNAPLLLPAESASRLAAYLNPDHVRLESTIQYLEEALHNKDDLIRGFEASLAETRTYLDTVIRDKDEVIKGYEASLEETRAYLDNVIESKDEVIDTVQANVCALEGRLDAEVRRRSQLTLPTVTVVVVNRNGERSLSACLASLRDLTYPDERYRVVVVDQASTDGSVEALRREFPNVTLLPAGSNIGLGAAINLAIEASESDHVALLSADAVADNQWLTELVRIAETDPTIGAVNSKVLLAQDRLPLSIEVSDTFVPGQHDSRRLAARVSTTAVVGAHIEPVEFVRGAFGPEHDELGNFRWITDSAEIRVPIADLTANQVVLRLLPCPFPRGERTQIRFRLHGRLVGDASVPLDDRLEVRVPFGRSDLRPVVRNIGSHLLPDGSRRDRGTVIAGNEVFYELDDGQYDRPGDLHAFRGTACLLRREALKQVGVFEPSFFQSYEDTDLSLRLRNVGWRIMSAPHSIAHHSSTSSIVSAPRFCYFAERNRLLMLMRNVPLSLAAKEWARYTARVVRPNAPAEDRKRFLQVQRSLIRRMPSALSARRRQGTGPLIKARELEQSDG